MLSDSIGWFCRNAHHLLVVEVNDSAVSCLGGGKWTKGVDVLPPSSDAILRCHPQMPTDWTSALESRFKVKGEWQKERRSLDRYEASGDTYQAWPFEELFIFAWALVREAVIVAGVFRVRRHTFHLPIKPVDRFIEILHSKIRSSSCLSRRSSPLMISQTLEKRCDPPTWHAYIWRAQFVVS